MTLGYLYNVQKVQDRRRQDVPFFGERRSGVDRRNTERLDIDTKLKQDIATTKKLLNEYKPDVFVKSEESKAASSFATTKPNKASEIVSMTASDKINSFISYENKKEIQKQKEKDDFLIEATFSAIGAGLGVIVPLIIGIANPIAIAGLAATGLTMGVFLGVKALDYYNGIDPNKK